MRYASAEDLRKVQLLVCICHRCGLSNRGCPTFALAYPDFLLRSISQDRVCGFH